MKTSLNSPWVYIQEGLLSEGYLCLNFEGLFSEGGGGLIIRILQFVFVIIVDNVWNIVKCISHKQGRGGYRQDQDSSGIEAYYKHSMVEDPWKELEEKYKKKNQES